MNSPAGRILSHFPMRESRSEALARKLAVMELRNEIEIAAPALDVWAVLGERFMHIGDWAAPITASSPVGSVELRPGAVRACTIAPFGPMKAGLIKERLTSFDRDALSFEYESIEGMPDFVSRATNRWTVVPMGEAWSLVSIHAALHLRGPIKLL